MLGLEGFEIQSVDFMPCHDAVYGRYLIITSEPVVNKPLADLKWTVPCHDWGHHKDQPLAMPRHCNFTVNLSFSNQLVKLTCCERCQRAIVPRLHHFRDSQNQFLHVYHFKLLMLSELVKLHNGVLRSQDVVRWHQDIVCRLMKQRGDPRNVLGTHQRGHLFLSDSDDSFLRVIFIFPI